MKLSAILFLCPFAALFAQEAEYGFDLRATVTAEAFDTSDLTNYPRDGSSLAGGFRSVLYPTFKLGDNWDISGAIQIISRPFFYEDYSTQGYGVKGQILQLNARYSRVWKTRSIMVRAGQLSSAFGTFPLRYDDAVNPVAAMPMEYGYYGGVSVNGLTGIQTDLTWANWDGRVQLTNSSPVNPRSIFARDQYGNWTGGAGYTIRQGLRVGASAFRGPYLDRQSAYDFPEVWKPSGFPATGAGLDAEWAAGHWNVYSELQRLEFDYPGNTPFREDTGYVEVKRVLRPRLYVAARAGYLHTPIHSGGEAYEFAAGIRPNSHQLVKLCYSFDRDAGTGTLTPVYALQIVTMLHPLSLAWR